MHFFTTSRFNKAQTRSNHQSHIYRNILNIQKYEYSVKIRDIFGVRFERRKVDKRANLHEN